MISDADWFAMGLIAGVLATLLVIWLGGRR